MVSLSVWAFAQAPRALQGEPSPGMADADWAAARGSAPVSRAPVLRARVRAHRQGNAAGFAREGWVGAMGTVQRPGTGGETVSLGHAVVAYLAALDHPASACTRQAYGSTLRILLALFGADADVIALRGPAVAEWFAGAWGASAPAASNRNRETLAGLAGFCEKQGWIPAAADVPRDAGRPGRTPPRPGTVPRGRRGHAWPRGSGVERASGAPVGRPGAGMRAGQA